MKKLISLITILLLVFSLSSCIPKGNNPTNDENNQSQQNTGTAVTPDTQPEPKVSDYLPFLKDIHIAYKGTGNEFASLDRYVDYVNGNRIQFRDVNAGTTMVNVFELDGDTLKRVYSSGENYYRLDCTSMNNNDEILIKGPIKAGTEWTLKDGSKRSITAVDKEIETPYGRLKALEITTINSDSTVQEYYAKDIGFAGSVFSTGDPEFKVKTEIEKFERSVPLEANMNIYFPDYEKNTVYYTEKSLALKTGDEPYKNIQEELKNVPPTAGLARVLTPGVQVNGVKLDSEKGTLVIDFSPQLVTEMNAGAGFESMLLECIADTFGNYYQVNKVGITLDGKPYISGHIVIEPGEYLDVKTSKAVKLGN